MKCLECGDKMSLEESEEIGDYDMHICKKCKKAYEKRDEIRKAFQILKKYAEMDTFTKDFYRISNFSWLQKEQMSLILHKFIKKFDLPVDEEGFTSEERKKEFKENKQNHKAHSLKILSDLRGLKGSLQKVPEDVAPDKDKGIYLKKAEKDVEELIEKYQQY